MTSVNIDGYRSYLAERNGEADLLNRRLERREEFFAQIESHPIRSERTVDAEAFERGVRSKRPAKGLSPELAFLLATGQAQSGRTLRRGSGRNLRPQQQRGPAAGTRCYLELEEHYHTRLLAYVLEIFGLPFRVVPPSYVLRQFVKSTSSFPRVQASRSSAPPKWRDASCSTS